ncbi:MAG: cytochrome C [Calditrichaeota bacterium]|nr:MAG: cytochrome C [Calditrichota bacterium]
MRLAVLTILTGFFLVCGAAVFLMGMYWERVEQPEPQPIAFPHDFHAGTGMVTLSTGEKRAGLGLPCTHCHVYVDKSRFATVPAVKICVDCHKGVQTKSQEAAKVMEYWDRQEPIPWVRIHKVKDFVYFSHKRHIKAGVDCAVCHGDMTVVKTVKKVRTFQMGFCVSCHRANGAPQDCWTCHK